jgi:hypothetical protein
MASNGCLVKQRDGKFHLSRYGQVLGDFDSMAAAARRAEEI